MAYKIKINNYNKIKDNNKIIIKKNIFLILFIISIIANGILVYFLYNYNQNKKELVSTKNELSYIKSDLNYAKNELSDIVGLRDKNYIRNKLDFFDLNIVFQIEGYGKYYYTYDCMMEKVDGEFSYWAYTDVYARSIGLKEGSC